MFPTWTRAFYRRPQGFDITTALFYEGASDDPSEFQVWCYTDSVSYRPGDEVVFHISASVPDVALEIVRDGANPQAVHSVEGLATQLRATPPDFYVRGCDWPPSYRWRIPADLESGFYLVLTKARDSTGRVYEQEHGFVVRPAAGRQAKPMLLVLSTCTWAAYNDWGGVNNYMSRIDIEGLPFAPRVSFQRPWARGIIWTHPGAPRKTHREIPPVGSVPRYPSIEFAYARGLGRFYAGAGWATYERPFCIWAENEGYHFDYASQLDLQDQSDLLDAYGAILFVGHDEYWSWEMRDTVDAYVERGGHVARFAGNFNYQVRLEGEGPQRTQVCYKDQGDSHDPLGHTPRIATHWSHPTISRPGAQTFGLNAAAGIYSGIGACVPRGPGGFTVYRPEHWIFEGADLHYGDVLGGAAQIFGFEIDGLDFTFRHGLPYATGEDGGSPDIDILAMGLTSNFEPDDGLKGRVNFYGDSGPAIAMERYNDTDPVHAEVSRRGAGMMVCYAKGEGQIFNAGSCEWVAGLIRRDLQTEIVTRNVLNRFMGASSRHPNAAGSNCPLKPV